jgi:serine/threonine protein kinase
MEVGSIINNYKVVRCLGGGGFGQVYLVQENITDVLRAIKKLNNNRPDQSDIIHEIQNIARLRLPNVAAYQHHFWEGEKLHFVMEYCAGGNLDSVIQSGDPTLEKVLEWVKISARCLEDVHKKGITHKDIKPLNILFDEEGNLKIGDFGLANRFGGTRPYMSPGALFGLVRTPNDPREDIYALGVTMLECLTEENPFCGKNPQEIYEIHQGLLFQLDLLPEWIQSVILKAINQVPELRFQTMAEFAEAIEAKQVPIVFRKDALEAGKLAENIQKLIKAKKWIKAQTLVEHGLETYPFNLKILEVAGDYFLKRRLIEMARSVFETAIQINPRINIQRQLGEIHLERKNIPKAISLLSDHLHRNSNDLHAQNLLIKCFYLSERYQAGYDLASELLKVFPSNPFFDSNQYLCEVLLYAESNLVTDSKIIKSYQVNPFIEYNLKVLFGGLKDKSHGFQDKPHIRTKLLFMESRFESIGNSKSAMTIINSNQKELVGRKFNNRIILFGREGFAVNDIQIPDGTVISRRHVVVINQKDDLWLYDLDSASGVKVNDYIVTGKIQLIGVSKIEIGSFWYRVTSDEGRLI